MKSVQGQKPDKALRKAVAEKRRSGQAPKGAQGLVIAASLAATMLGWAFFAHEDAQPLSPTDQEVPTVVAATQQSTASTSAPTVSTIQPSPTASTASSLTTHTNATDSTVSTSAPQAITRTRSSQ